MPPPWENLIKNAEMLRMLQPPRASPQQLQLCCLPQQPSVFADGDDSLPQPSPHELRSLLDKNLQPQFFHSGFVEMISTPHPREKYYYMAMLPEEAKGVNEDQWRESAQPGEFSRPAFPFTDIVMLVTSIHPPSASLRFDPPYEFFYLYEPPPQIFDEEDGVCLQLAFGENDKHQMTSEESNLYYLELLRMGKYDELPVPRGSGSNLVYHVAAEAIGKLELSFGCEQALDIYNQIRNAQLTFVEVVKANCQSRPSRRIFYVTFRVRNLAGGCEMFQAELILFAGSIAYIVWQVRRT